MEMRKACLGVLVVAVTVAFAFGTAFAGVGNELNGFHGKHFNLNIIGVPKDKTVPDMTGSNRHTIFVPLNNTADDDEDGEVDRKVKIKYVINEENPDKFQVLDGNATDDNEAIIAVPYEYCDDLEAGCTELTSFAVFAVGLGKPGPDTVALVTAECEYILEVVDPDGTEGLTCEDTLLMGSFEIRRKKGPPKPVDITDIFRATGCLDLDAVGEEGYGICSPGDLAFRNMWIFNIPYLFSYMWDYENNNLKLMQVRFYPTNPEDDWIGYVD
jgi:hypothetical protein